MSFKISRAVPRCTCMVAGADPVFAVGLECAVEFKRKRGDPYSFDGVPDGSVVRRFA